MALSLSRASQAASLLSAHCLPSSLRQEQLYRAVFCSRAHFRAGCTTWRPQFSTSVVVENLATADRPQQAAEKKDHVAPPLQGTNLQPEGKSSSLKEEGGSLSVVVLGASGDLAKKFTFPALYALYRNGHLPKEQIRIFGYARSEMTDKDLHERLEEYLHDSETSVDSSDSEKDTTEFFENVKYISGPYDNDEGFENLDKSISEFEKATVDKKPGPKRRLFYIALPPKVYVSVAEKIKGNLLGDFQFDKGDWTRLVIEKPFGRDLESGERLVEEIGNLFDEEQIYRIDHYLGKELVQNLMVLRFSNYVFGHIWNKDCIANVQITLKEDFGVEGRGSFFDEYGVIRDVMQNHLLQTLCLVAMEAPKSTTPEDIRNAKVDLLESIAPPDSEEVVLGQYTGYRQDESVPDDSITPTFCTMVLRINNHRWQGVPFVLKSGKGLDVNKSEIRIQFKDAPGDIFNCCSQEGRNELVLQTSTSQPSIYLKTNLKQPGLDMVASQAELDLSYKPRFAGVSVPGPYERLLLDTIRGDQEHFLRRDEVRAGWKIFTPILKKIEDDRIEPIIYKEGTRGPKEADELIKKIGYVRTKRYAWEEAKGSDQEE